MWRVVTWPVRSRPARRVLLVWLGLVIRRRLRATGGGLWSHEEAQGGRSWWRRLLAVLLGGLAIGLVLRRRLSGPSTNEPTPAAAPDPPAVDPTPRSTPAAERTPPSTAAAATPQVGVAEGSRVPEQPDLAAGEAVIGRRLAVDDLKVVEGIGPKIEQLLNDSGVQTWYDLSSADVDRLRGILSEAGARYRMHDPSTWPQQATLLARGDWEAFATPHDGDPDS